MSKFGNREAAYEKIPWFWIISAAIFLPFMGCIMQYYLRSAETVDLGKLGYVQYFNAMPLIIYFIILIISRFKKASNIRMETLAYIYAAAAISIMYGGYSYPFHWGFSGIIGTRYFDSYGLAERYISPLWSPSKATLTTFIYGGPISFEWIPVMIYWPTLAVAIWVCIAGFSIFLRYQWIEVENLPYPYATVSIDFIDSLKEPKGPKVKLILIATIIAFILWLPVYIRANFTWFPDLYGWFNPITHNTGYWASLRPQNVMPSVYQSAVGLTQICYNPLYVALAMFIPLNTLLSASFFYVFYILVGTQIAYLMGQYTGINVIDDGSRTGMIRNRPPIVTTVTIEHGLIITTLIMAIVLNYKNTILRPLRLALSKEPSGGQERNEPVSYRMALIMIIVSSVAIVSMLAISGFAVDDAFIWLGMAILMQLSYARIRGYAGPVPVGANVGPLFFRWKYPNITMDNIPRSFYLYGVSQYSVTDANSGYGGINFPIFESWRVGASLGVNNRSIFKVMIVVAVIAPFIGFATYVCFGSLVGISHTAKSGLNNNGPNGTPMHIYTTPALHIWPNFLAGALLAIFLSFMLYHFVWWPLDPVGAYIGCGGPGVKVGLGFVFIIAYIIKYITLKVGGTKLYTDKVSPLAVGFILGSAFAAILGSILGIVTFIRPM